MGKIFIFFVIAGFLLTNCYGQSEIQDNRLLQLKKPTEVTPKYVNFDVIKVMIGSGFSPDKIGDKDYAPCLDIQILKPTAWFKHCYIHTVIGGSIGYSSIAWKKEEWSFSNNNIAVINSGNVTRAVLKTGYLGPTILLMMQTLNKRIEIMAGTSILFNVLGDKLITRYETQKKFDYLWNYTNLISLPVKFQIDYKPKRWIGSIGVFSSYDLLPRFKLDTYKDIRQICFGLSGGLTI